jgi:hexosaminidase
VDNDGLHSAQERSGQITLQKGLYPFSLDFIEGGGGYKLRLQYGKQNEETRNIPDNLFVHKKR